MNVNRPWARVLAHIALMLALAVAASDAGPVLAQPRNVRSTTAPVAAMPAVLESEKVQVALDGAVETLRIRIKSLAEDALPADVSAVRSAVNVTLVLNRAKLAARLRELTDAMPSSELSPASVGPADLAARWLEGASPALLARYLNQVMVTVSVDSEMSEANRAALGKLVEARVGTLVKAPLKVAVEAVDFAAPAHKERLEKAERAKRDLETERARLSQERDRAEAARRDTDNALRQGDIVRKQDEAKAQALLAENESLKKKLRTAEEELSVYKTPLGEIKRIIKGLEVPLMVLPAAAVAIVCVALALAAYVLVSSRRTAQFKETMEIVAGSLNRLAPRPSTVSARANMGTLEASSSARPLVAGGQPGGNGYAGVASFAQEEFQTLRKEAFACIEECKEHPFLMRSELYEWLHGDDEDRLRFASFLSVLGATVSTDVLDSFPPKSTDRLKTLDLDFNARLSGYAAALTLHATVFARVRRRDAVVNGINGLSLLRATDDELAQALGDASPTERAAVLSVLLPARWHRVMEALARQIDQGEIAKTLSSLTRPEFSENALVANAIHSFEAHLKLKLAREPEARHLDALDLISSHMTRFSPRLRAALSDAMRVERLLDEGIRSRTLTFADVLGLDDELLAEMLEPYTSEQVAQLVFRMEDTERARILNLLTQNVRTAVRADMARIEKSPALRKRSESEALDMQRACIEQLQQFIADGVVDPARRRQGGGAA